MHFIFSATLSLTKDNQTCISGGNTGLTFDPERNFQNNNKITKIKTHANRHGNYNGSSARVNLAITSLLPDHVTALGLKRGDILLRPE